VFRSARPLWGWGLALALLGARAHAQPQGDSESEAADAPSPATSAEADGKAQARRHYTAGVESYEAGQFRDAIDHFLEANRLAPSPALSFNIARAYEKLGDDAGALGFYRDYLRRAPEAEDRAEVERIIAELESRLRAKGVQQVTVLSEPDRATVVVDGKPVGVTPWTGEIYPGQHRLQLRLPGYQDTEEVFALTAHRARDVSVTLEPVPEEPKPQATEAAPAPTPVQPTPTPDQRPAAGDTGTQGAVSAWTWVTLGVGVGALGGSLAFELMRSSAEDDARTADTQIDAQEHYDTMESRQLVARILAGAGAAATVVGGVLLYLDLTAEPSGPESARLGFGCGPGACSVTASGRF